MSTQPINSPSLDRDIANLGRLLADGIFFPVYPLNAWISNIEVDLNKKDRSLEIPTPATVARDVKEFFFDYHQRVTNFGVKASESIQNSLQNLLEKAFSWLTFFETGKAIREIIANKVSALARVISFGAIQIFHAIPYLIASAIITGLVLLYQASPLGFLCLMTGAVFSVQVLQSYFIAKGVTRTGNILQKELDLKKLVLQEKEIVQKLVENKRKEVNEVVDRYTQKTPPLSWFTTGSKLKRTAATAAAAMTYIASYHFGMLGYIAPLPLLAGFVKYHWPSHHQEKNLALPEMSEKL